MVIAAKRVALGVDIAIDVRQRSVSVCNVSLRSGFWRDAGMAGRTGGDAGYADQPDGAADPGAGSDQQPGVTDGGRS